MNDHLHASRTRHRGNKRDPRYRYLLRNTAVAAAALAAIIWITFSYRATMEGSIEADISQTLEEIAAQSVLLIRERVTNDIDSLNGIAQTIAESGQPVNSDWILEALKWRKENTNFSRLAVADMEGYVYNALADGSLDISDRDYFKKAASGSVVISNVVTSLKTEQKVINSAVPILRENQVIGVLIGQYSIDELARLLDISTFHGEGFSYVMDGEGKVFLHSSHPSADHNFHNLHTDFSENITFPRRDAFPKMEKDLELGKSGEIFYNWNDSERIMNYTPIGLNDWYLLSVVPRNVVTRRSSLLFRQTANTFSAILLVLVSVLLYAFNLSWKSRQKLKAAHKELSVLYSTMPGSFFRCRDDEDWTVTFANDNFYRFLGYGREEFEDKFHNRLREIIETDDYAAMRANVYQQLGDSSRIANEQYFRLADGEIRCVFLNSEYMADEHGEHFWYCTFLDISEMKQMQEELKINQERYEVVINQSQDTIFDWNLSDHTIYYSRNFLKKFGYEPATENFPENIVASGMVYSEDTTVLRSFLTALEKGESTSEIEVRLHKADGTYIWCRIAATFLKNADFRPCRVIGSITDIDSQMERLRQMEEAAKHDPLTQLYNKKVSEALVRDYLNKSKRPAALLVIDVDNFKHINDTMGHLYGDSVLSQISQSLSQLFLNTDVAGRIGGDEFIVFLEDLPEGELPDRKVRAVAEILSRTFSENFMGCDISCSIGVSLYPADGSTYEELFCKADTAMYHSKENGKNQFSYYSPAMGMIK